MEIKEEALPALPTLVRGPTGPLPLLPLRGIANQPSFSLKEGGNYHREEEGRIINYTSTDRARERAKWSCVVVTPPTHIPVLYCT